MPNPEVQSGGMTSELPQKPNDLHDFILAATQDIAREYERIQKRATEDPGTAGDQGEENWAQLLRGWLPPAYQVVTKGRILSAKGTASPQVDVIVLHPTYPQHLLNKKLYLAGGVAAAFECKVTLRAGHIGRAVKNAVEIRKHLSLRFGTPYKELHSPIIYGLLAHSHHWKVSKSKPEENVSRKLLLADANNVQHPREMLDLLCVADIATWSASRRSWVGPGMIPDWSQLEWVYGPEGSAGTSYHRYDSSVGTLIISLLRRLAWEDVNIRQLAEYLLWTGVKGSGRGKGERRWPADIFSEPTRNKAASCKLNLLQTQDDWNRLLYSEPWNEWSLSFH